MDTGIVVIGVIVYSFFAIRWGYRFVDGRWAWLEGSEMKIPKVIIGVVVGYVFVGLYFILWLLKTLERLFMN